MQELFSIVQQPSIFTSQFNCLFFFLIGQISVIILKYKSHTMHH